MYVNSSEFADIIRSFFYKDKHSTTDFRVNSSVPLADKLNYCYPYLLFIPEEIGKFCLLSPWLMQQQLLSHLTTFRTVSTSFIQNDDP